MKIALAQTDIIWNEPERNHAIAEDLALQATAAGADFLIFPEMFDTGFSFPLGDAARFAQETGRACLQRIARRYGIYVAGSLPELDRQSQRPRNTLSVYGPEGLLGDYSKLHLIRPLGEGCYQAGDRRLLLTIGGMRVCFAICYDLRFSPLFYDVAEQTDLYVIVANWPSPRHAHWLALLTARAIENQAYVAGVNRVGVGDGFTFLGGSRIVSPAGETLADGGSSPGLIIAGIDPETVACYRSELPFLRDRRPISG